MVCSLGSRRMEAMARLLTAGSFSQTIAEEVGNQKLAAQFIQREFREADEANLLDEEDMHIFDLKPMTDPLHLVCCNACKKPIKASQYAAHAELCKYLSSAQQIVSELDGGTGHKKPPRKERKKLLTAYDTTMGGEQEQIESAEAIGVTMKEFHMDEQVQVISSFSTEAKRNSSCAEGARIMDSSRASPRNTDYSTGAMPPPTKRSKLIAAEGLPMSDHLATTSAAAKTSTQEAHTCREFREGLSGRSEKTSDCVFGYPKSSQNPECCLLSKDGPAPLATKMFYSQRNHRLRSALAYLYYGSSSKEHSGDFVSSKALQGQPLPLQDSSPENNSNEQINVQREKRENHSVQSAQKSDQTLADNLDASLDKVGGRTPTTSYSNHVPLNNASRHQTSPTGITRSNYLSKSFAFAGNSGTALGTMQQPKGSVPVT